METVDKTAQGIEATEAIWVDPDLAFIERLNKRSGETFKKCFQCGTCSGTCSLSPDPQSFPSKEMAWAAWGMKDRLFKDPDVWLCYQCNDCSASCPRSAKPGDVLGAVRQECVIHYAFPGFLGRWVNEPLCVPLLLGIPVALLTGALALRDPVEKALGITQPVGEKIHFAYSNLFPHWLLNSFFFFFSFLALVAVLVGARRLWKAMKTTRIAEGRYRPVKGVLPSFGTVLKSVFTHDQFAKCQRSRSRHLSHMCVFFGFIALTMVTIWVITAKINPLIRGDFIYPFSFWSPWKMLANAGGLAVVIGCGLMIVDRLRKSDDAGAGSYFDWALLVMILLVVFTGFFTEVLHYVRLEPHRHIVYFVHLVFIFMLLIYLPYSKLAHIVYRTVALVFAEHTGRTVGAQLAPEHGRRENDAE